MDGSGMASIRSDALTEFIADAPGQMLPRRLWHRAGWKGWKVNERSRAASVTGAVTKFSIRQSSPSIPGKPAGASSEFRKNGFAQYRRRLG